MNKSNNVTQATESATIEKTEVLGWLLAYHTKSFDLKGRYLPHEVISWLINDISKTLFEGTEEWMRRRGKDENNQANS